MSDPVGLVVPIRLEALLAGGGDLANDFFMPPYANFQNLPSRGGDNTNPYLSSLILNAPFTGAHALGQGIHLHWNLPSALRAGVYDQAGNLDLPHAPDRWLVTQLLADTSTTSRPSVTLKSWVIESNFLSDDSTHSPTSIPFAPSAVNPLPYRFMGRVYEYDDWLANGGAGTYFTDLTALGFGVPDFASFYPNCINVFAMLDVSLSSGYDPSTHSLAYAVTGWYSNPADDPLHGTSLDGTGNSLGWTFNSGPEAPSFSLYHGAVYGVGWNPDSAYFNGGEVPVTPVVGLGNTPMEAFSAMVAYQLRNTPGLPDIEPLLNALQLGVLRELDQAGGLAALDDALEKRSYASGASGLLWDIQPNDGGGATLLRRLAGDAGAALESLNRAQLAYDAETQTALSLRAQIFADWQKFITVLSAADPQLPNPADVFTFINSEIAALQQITAARLPQLAATVASVQQAIEASLPEGLSLVSTAAPRYYRANDPVVVLSGDGVPPSPPDNAETIVCVLTTQLVTALELPAGLVSGSDPVVLQASVLPSLDNAGKLPHPAAAALLQTDLLVNPQPWGVVTAAIAAAGEPANPAVLDFTETNAAVMAAQAFLLGGPDPSNGLTFTGTAPQAAVGFRPWATPWHPIALSWQFDFQPVLDVSSTGYPATFVLDNFLFDPALGSFALKSGALGTVPHPYTGATLLSPDAALSLQNEIRLYLQHETDRELSRILADLTAAPLLAQSFGGSNDALIMRDETMQLPVADPLAPTELFFHFSNTVVPLAVGDQNRLAPLPNVGYNPMRAGGMTLQQLWLIDEFGRFRTVDFSQLAVSETIPTTGTQPVQLLPPLRITQGAQLTFRWLSAADPSMESSSVPETNPICGFVVPSHLETSLLFYDADGVSIGSLSVAFGGKSFVWQNAPGTGKESGTMEKAFADANPILSALARSVVDNGPAYLAELIRTIDSTKTFIAPQSFQEDRSTAALIGQPLAIVQATLDLDLWGLPAPDQSFAALQNDIDGANPLTRSVHGFTNVHFPVILGSLSRLDDGLIGYFLGDAAAPDFGTLYANAGGDDPHIAIPESGTIQLTAAPGTVPTTVTMLLDPRCDVHAFTGVAPVKSIGVPPDLFAAAQSSMTFTFLTSPVLRTADRFAIPVPAEGTGRWSWVTWGSAGWTESDIESINFSAALQMPSQLLEGWLKLTPQ